MRWTVGILCLLFLLAFIGQETQAQDTQKQLVLSYHARETLNLRDNDIFRLSYAVEDPGFADLSRIKIFGGFRDVGLNIGSSSRDTSFDKLDFGIEAHWLKERPNGRGGVGFRVNYTDDHETSFELAYIREYFGNAIDFRFVGGVQAVTDKVVRRDSSSLFGVAEATWWVRDNFLVRTGAQADSDGELATAGFEFNLGRSSASFFMDFAMAINRYRGISEYNDVIGGIRFDLGKRKRRSLRDVYRNTSTHSFHRTVEVQ